MSWFLYAFGGWEAAGAVMTIALIGKDRKPITAGGAIFTLLTAAGWITLLVLAAGRLR